MSSQDFTKKTMEKIEGLPKKRSLYKLKAPLITFGTIAVALTVFFCMSLMQNIFKDKNVTVTDTSKTVEKYEVDDLSATSEAIDEGGAVANSTKIAEATEINIQIEQIEKEVEAESSISFSEADLADIDI